MIATLSGFASLYFATFLLMIGSGLINTYMALRLSDLLGTSAEMWLGMQSAHDLWQAAQQPRPVVQRIHSKTTVNPAFSSDCP